jgi:hypothetical protein
MDWKEIEEAKGLNKIYKTIVYIFECLIDRFV